MTARSPEQDTAPDEPADSREIRRRLTFGVGADLPVSLSPWQRAVEAWRAAGIPWRHAPAPDEPSAAKPRPVVAEPARGEGAGKVVPVSPTVESETDHAESHPASAGPMPGKQPVPSAAEPEPDEGASAVVEEDGTASEVDAEEAAAAADDGAEAGVSQPVEETPVEPDERAADTVAAEPRPDASASEETPAEPDDTGRGAAEPSAARPGRRAPAGSGIVAMAAKRTKTGEPAAVEPEPEPEPAAAAEPAPVPPRRRVRRTRRALAGVAAATGIVVVAGGAVFVAGRGEGEPVQPSVPGPVAAGARFAFDPAAKNDGLVQELAAVEAAGRTVVAVGTEDDAVPGGGRAEFLVSSDGGRAWSVGTARTAAGTVPPRGDRPRLVAGGSGRWAALGQASGGAHVAWTSRDGRTWTRRPLAAAFRPSDKVNDLVRTPAGFVAVGVADGRGVVWSSADGRVWHRIDGIRGISGLYGVAASGNVLVTQGTYPKKVTRKKDGEKVERTVAAQGLWRSADGGRTWQAVRVPQSHGTYGPTKGLVAGPGGFFTVRNAKKKKDRYGVAFASADGAKWNAVGVFDISGYRGVEAFGGSPDGLVVVLRGKQRVIGDSKDGRDWNVAGKLDRAEVRGLTVAAGGEIAIAGKLGTDAYLFGVDLAKVPGAVRRQRAIGSLAAAKGRVVAVGGSSGGAAVWSSPDGRTWARATFPAAPGRLTDVAHGAHGWLAVGRTGEAPLALTSSDGVTWRKAPFPAGRRPVAVATGPAGYVAVGTGAAWRSADLKTWRTAVVDGAPADVTATATGYVAVGERADAPAAWTSPDGATWRAVRLPAGLKGPLTDVAAHGGTVVAVGPGAPPLVSSDGGATWTPRGIGAVSPSAVTATPDGFVVAGVAEGRDGVVFASPDGAEWSRVPVPGLDGPADRRLTALTSVGGGVLGTGTADGGRAVTPLLWHADVLGSSLAVAE